MSTNDVPGFDPKNRDELAMGCWAEHEDGSMILVESTEGGRVVYSIFDMSKQPIVEYRDTMPEKGFKKSFSWAGKDKGKGKDDADKIKWTWHDKTPFPWDSIIKDGATDGVRFASAGDQLTAAERVAESLRLRGKEVSNDTLTDRAPRTRTRAAKLIRRLQRSLEKLGDELEGPE